MEKEKEHMLTTIDNPFSPFDQFEEWYQFDMEKGYNTCGFLARIAISDSDNEDLDRMATEAAIEEICKYNVLGIYKSVTRDDFDVVKTD